jgi:hypothetical protein
LAEPGLSFALPRRHARIGLAHSGSVAAVAASLAVALGVLAELDPSAARISGPDLAAAHERMSLKEARLETLERPQARPFSRRGEEAAEQTALDADEGMR